LKLAEFDALEIEVANNFTNDNVAVMNSVDEKTAAES